MYVCVGCWTSRSTDASGLSHTKDLTQSRGGARGSSPSSVYKAWRAVVEAAPAKARRCWWCGSQGDDGGARPAPCGGSRNAQGRAERSRSCSAAKTPIVVRPPLLLPRAPALAAARAAGRRSIWLSDGGLFVGMVVGWFGVDQCVHRPHWMTDAASECAYLN